MSYSSELQVAIKAARSAGKYLLGLGHKIVDSREGRDIKLRADRESEAIILAALEPTRLPVLAEESGEHGSRSGLRWIVDPIDGTMNYYRGLRDLCCVSIALWEDDRPVVGVVNRFAVDELYTGIVGEGAWCNETPLRTSTVKQINQAVFAGGFPVGLRLNEEMLPDFFRRILRFKKIRMLGTAALMSAFVGAGSIDVYSEDGVMLWDVAAGIAITRAAGGRFQAEPLDGFRYNVRCFANEILERLFLEG